MPFISTLEKSIDRRKVSSWSRRSPTGATASSATSANDSPSDIAMTPIVVGSPTKRWFMYARIAVTTRQMARMSNMGCRSEVCASPHRAAGPGLSPACGFVEAGDAHRDRESGNTLAATLPEMDERLARGAPQA